MSQKSNKAIFYIMGALFLAVFLIWSQIFSFNLASVLNAGKQPELKVIFFDVGQGNAVFIEAPNGNQVLIDGGSGSQILNKLGNNMPFFDRSIDIVILTHPDADHINGLIDIIKKYEVGEVVDSCISDSSAAYAEWEKLIDEKKINRLCAAAGQKIKLSDDVGIDILFPFKTLENMSFKNTNDSSIVAKLTYGNSKVLLTGDTEEKTEYQLISSSVNLQAQVLQVGHHGSKSSSSENFLKVVKPEIAIIQVGVKNRYGHPAQQTLDRLLKVNAEVFRTDLYEDVKFSCSEKKCDIIKK